MVNSTPPYEWVFSGIGVAIISWLGVWAYRHYHKTAPGKHPESLSQVKISDSTVIGPVAGRDISIGTLVQHGPLEPTDEYRETPTTFEIAVAIERAPLYLRKSVANNYSGLKVRWQAQIASIRVLRDGQVEVALEVSDRAGYVALKVSLDEYPILKIVHGGEPVEVFGTIDWVQENALIHLKDAKLKFLPQ